MVTSLEKISSEAFRFLESSFKFQRVLSSETLVRWESNNVFVQIRYDAHRSFEVSLEIGQTVCKLPQLGPPFSLGEVLGVAGLPLAQRPFFQASTEERLKAALNEIAQLLVRYGLPFLQNDADAFVALTQQRRIDCDIYAQERDLRQIREAADNAWHVSDYRTVVKLYRDKREFLTATETKRYEIALKHLSAINPAS